MRAASTFPHRGGGSRDLHVLEVAGLVVDPDARRGDPARVFAWFVTGLHQRADEAHVVVVGQPVATSRCPLLFGQHLAGGAYAMARKLADAAVEALVRLDELERDAG